MKTAFGPRAIRYSRSTVNSCRVRRLEAESELIDKHLLWTLDRVSLEALVSHTAFVRTNAFERFGIRWRVEWFDWTSARIMMLESL